MRNFTQNITLEMVSDVLCSAFEGGSNSWYWIDEFIDPTIWEFDSDPHDQHKHYAQDYPLNPGGALFIRDMNDETIVCLDWEAVQKGLDIMASQYPNHFVDMLSEDYDAITGDVLLQCCCFSEVIY